MHPGLGPPLGTLYEVIVNSVNTVDIGKMDTWVQGFTDDLMNVLSRFCVNRSMFSIINRTGAIS